MTLLLTIGATLRSEPELRTALASAGMDAVMQVAGRKPSRPHIPQTDYDSSLPTSHIKVNRIGNPARTLDGSASSQIIAQDLARTLAAQSPVE